MKLLTVTNNPLLRNEVTAEQSELIFLDGTVIDVLVYCMEMMGRGWMLAVDPLAGYLSRPNPFHTIILQWSGQIEVVDAVEYLQSIASLEKLIEKYKDEQEDYVSAAATSRRRSDHGEVDLSIAIRSLERLL